MTGTVFLANPGEVYHLWCGQCHQAKYKYFVVAYTEPRLRYFLINSAPAPFQRPNAELMKHQVELTEADHRFLRHDSVLDVSTVMGGDTIDELREKYAENQNIYLGQIAPEPRAVLRTIVADSRVLTEREKAAILDAW